MPGGSGAPGPRPRVPLHPRPGAHTPTPGEVPAATVTSSPGRRDAPTSFLLPGRWTGWAEGRQRPWEREVPAGTTEPPPWGCQELWLPRGNLGGAQGCGTLSEEPRAWPVGFRPEQDPGWGWGSAGQSPRDHSRGHPGQRGGWSQRGRPLRFPEGLLWPRPSGPPLKPTPPIPDGPSRILRGRQGTEPQR